MIFQRDINWRHGSFLEPQHFQLLELRRRLEAGFLTNALSPYAYGFTDLQINETSLLSHFLEILKLDLLLPDGRHLIYPDNLDIKAGSFREAFDLTQDQLMVYLATPFFQLS
ncbi:MAG: type VI secretion system baseplate subunit TssK, partial [Deltaproteobacteria bacterium]|nr:type VI secretion system baseplate subunit TssK [Deltaproteobacteria bacterium]